MALRYLLSGRLRVFVCAISHTIPKGATTFFSSTGIKARKESCATDRVDPHGVATSSGGINKTGASEASSQI
jgi:hypothetical protein